MCVCRRPARSTTAPRGMGEPETRGVFPLFACLFVCSLYCMRKQEHKNVHCFHWYPISHYLCLVFWEHALHFKTTTKPHGDTITPWMCLFSCPHPGSGPQMRGSTARLPGVGSSPPSTGQHAPSTVRPCMSQRVPVRGRGDLVSWSQDTSAQVWGS